MIKMGQERRMLVENSNGEEVRGMRGNGRRYPDGGRHKNWWKVRNKKGLVEDGGAWRKAAAGLG